MSSFAERVKEALHLDGPGYFRERPESMPAGRPAAVLLLFADDGSKVSDPELLLTVRTETVLQHRGQVAFPGGAADEEDTVRGGLSWTALRETEEEVGIRPELVRVIGALPELWTVSDYSVVPFVGLLQAPKSDVVIKPSEAEIAETFWVKLSMLRDPGIYSEDWREWKGMRFKTHVFQVGPHRVWGATAAMIKNLLDRLERVS
jgi:8-oxo-dGTP pyrophosphatase MutT (NUDIX family)